MIKAITLWKLPEGVSEADFERWYEERHVPEVKSAPGLKRYATNRIKAERASTDSYYRMAEFEFDSLEEMDRAMSSPPWKSAVADAGQWIASPVRYIFDSTLRLPEGGA